MPRLGPDARQLRLLVELLRAQLVGPHAGRVDDVRRTDLEARAALDVERLDALGVTVVLEQAGDGDAVGADRAEALGLAQHGQHEAHVVGLAVVEEIAARRLARGERGQQLEHFLAGDHAMALGAPGLAALPHRLCSARALAALASARRGARGGRGRRDITS